MNLRLKKFDYNNDDNNKTIRKKEKEFVLNYGKNRYHTSWSMEEKGKIQRDV